MRGKSYIIILCLIIIMTILFYQNTLDTNLYRNPREFFGQILQGDHKNEINPLTLNIDVIENAENIPDIYFDGNQVPTRFNKSCARFPNLFDLKFQNNYWQIQKTTKGTFHLFNAFLDKREKMVIRIVGMYNQYLPKNRFYCQLWYSIESQPVIVESETLFWMWRKGWGADRFDLDQPYLITCPLPVNKTRIPMSVSLVEKPCDFASNNLKIFSKVVDKKKNFVVCVKGLSFPNEDKNTRLAEWIELLLILGAEKISFYEFNLYPVSKMLLRYYEKLGKIDVTLLTLVGDVSNHPDLQQKYLKSKTIERRLQEVIPYNDCLYKHINEFKHVVLLDTDEVIVPVEHTWTELMEELQKKHANKSTYGARNIYFLDSYSHNHEWFADIPKYMHMLQHVFRAKNYTQPGYFIKGFHDTNQVLALHNHFPFACLKSCSALEIDLKLAHLQHYRPDCASGVGNCAEMKKDSIIDTRVWQYKEQLIERVQKTFRDLNLFYDED